ncbi:hypothetical protein CF326_g9827 [Tilletia indica]|nr:hypothetical protein CF326_g9827 [Tilletia indica]
MHSTSGAGRDCVCVGACTEGAALAGGGEEEEEGGGEAVNEDGGGMEGPGLRKVDDAEEEEEEPELQPFAGRDSAHAYRVSPALVRRFLQRVCILTYRTHGALQPSLLPPSGKLHSQDVHTRDARAGCTRIGAATSLA